MDEQLDIVKKYTEDKRKLKRSTSELYERKKELLKALRYPETNEFGHPEKLNWKRLQIAKCNRVDTFDAFGSRADDIYFLNYIDDATGFRRRVRNICGRDVDVKNPFQVPIDIFANTKILKVDIKIHKNGGGLGFGLEARNKWILRIHDEFLYCETREITYCYFLNSGELSSFVFSIPPEHILRHLAAIRIQRWIKKIFDRPFYPSGIPGPRPSAPSRP